MTAVAPSRRAEVLDPVARRLHARFGPAVDLETVRQVLDESYDRLLVRATVTTYLVVLAERVAAARLTAGAAADPSAVGLGPSATS